MDKPTAQKPSADTDACSYAEMQRDFYNRSSESLENANATVGPFSPQMGLEMARYLLFQILNEFSRRSVVKVTGQSAATSTTELLRQTTDSVCSRDIRILDFGCGVGRVMEAAVESEYSNIDGVDISEAMLEHARGKAELKGSSFFLSSGTDCGDAPSAYYDIVYSVLCMHHICVHETRMLILKDMVRALKDDGMVCLQFLFFPKIAKSDILPGHAAWRHNKYDAGATNSGADAWITTDQLGAVYSDMESCLHDISFGVVELQKFPKAVNPYVHHHHQLFICGSKRAGLWQQYFSPNRWY